MQAKGNSHITSFKKFFEYLLHNILKLIGADIRKWEETIIRQGNNLLALVKEISSAMGVQWKAAVSFTPMASGDPGPSQVTYCTKLFLDPSLPPSATLPFCESTH